jgi:hypothetical protein
MNRRLFQRRADNLGMAVFIAALLFFFSSSVGAQAQSNWDYLSKSPERLIGLLDLPEIVAGGCGPAARRAMARAFGAPSQNGPSVGTIFWHEEGDAWCGLMIEQARGSKERVPTLESGYEVPAAIVYERRGPWFRIRLRDGSAWLRHDDQKDFLSYPDVLRENLAHTMQSWDGTLRATPGPTVPARPLSSGWKALLDRQLNIQYLGSRKVGNDLWIHIRLASKGGCDRVYEGVTDVDGWIPAYHTDRTPLAWFSSRGC